MNNCCSDRHSTKKYVMSAKNNIAKYGRDVVTFVTNKIIKNTNFNYPPK